MHHSLRILDIIGSIFQFVYDDSSDGLKDVAALAIVCRAFKDPALDVLWQTLETVAPLIMCLPNDAWEVKYDVEEEGLVLSLKRATTEAEWARSKLHASRIRTLGYPTQSSAREIDVDPDVLEIMSITQVLSFPKLQNLRLNVGNLPLHNLIVRPSLVKFEMNFGEEDLPHLIPTLLDFLPAICPSLRCLQILSTYTSRSDISPFPRLVGGLNHLERLACIKFTLPDEALRILATSSTLRILHINNTAEDFVRALPPNEISFTQMKCIAIRTLSMESCCVLFNRIGAGCLKSIAIEHTNQRMPIAADIQEFFTILEKRCSHALLTSVAVRQDSGVPDNTLWQSSHYTISSTVIKPLLAFKNLEILDLSFTCPYDFDNTSMEIMTAAWPLMRLFNLGTEDGWGDEPSNVTLDGLIPVAKSWPRLEFLSLCIDPVTSQIKSRRPGGGHSCPRLICVQFMTSAMDAEPAITAAFLSDLFPNLHVILATDFEDEWKEVEGLVRVFADVRKQERAWKEVT